MERIFLVTKLSLMQVLMDSCVSPMATGGAGSNRSSEEDEVDHVSGHAEDAMTMVMESLLKAATGSGPTSLQLEDGDSTLAEGSVARDRAWSTASTTPVADPIGKLALHLGSRYNIIVKNKRDKLAMPDLRGGKTVLPFIGSFMHCQDGRTLNAQIRENFRENHFFSVSFDPKTFCCTGCWGRGEDGNGHSLEGKKGEQVGTKCFVAIDHCFPPTVFAGGGTAWESSVWNMAWLVKSWTTSSSSLQAGGKFQRVARS